VLRFPPFRRHSTQGTFPLLNPSRHTQFRHPVLRHRRPKTRPAAVCFSVTSVVLLSVNFSLREDIPDVAYSLYLIKTC
jgi:hypothetical protein